MNTKVVRLDSPKDSEATEWANQAQGGGFNAGWYAALISKYAGGGVIVVY